MYSTRLLTGTIFCVTAALLYAINYVVAFLYVADGLPGASRRLYDSYEYIGRDLQWAAAGFLVVGIIYLLRASTTPTGSDRTR